MAILKWNEVGKYDEKIMWDKQNLNLPELGQDVLIFFPDTDSNCRKNEYTGENILFDKYGRIIIGYFYLTKGEEVSITDGYYDFGYIREGIKWAEYNRPSQPDKQVKMCENFVCKKYDRGIESKCSEVPCKECDDRNCVNCKLYLSQSPKCKNCRIW